MIIIPRLYFTDCDVAISVALVIRHASPCLRSVACRIKKWVKYWTNIGQILGQILDKYWTKMERSWRGIQYISSGPLCVDSVPDCPPSPSHSQISLKTFLVFCISAFQKKCISCISVWKMPHCPPSYSQMSHHSQKVAQCGNSNNS